MKTIIITLNCERTYNGETGFGGEYADIRFDVNDSFADIRSQILENVNTLLRNGNGTINIRIEEEKCVCKVCSSCRDISKREI